MTNDELLKEIYAKEHDLGLHYFSGFAFFIIISILFITLFRLVKINIVFSGLLFSVLLRSYTDSVLFLTLFDYILVLFIIIAFLILNL